MHCYNLLDNFDWNIREPASHKHPIQTGADRKTRKASERIQDQSQECQSTSVIFIREFYFLVVYISEERLYCNQFT